MKLRTLKRRYARRPLTGWTYGIDLGKHDRAVWFCHSVVTTEELRGPAPLKWSEPVPLIRGELGVVDCGYRFVNTAQP